MFFITKIYRREKEGQNNPCAELCGVVMDEIDEIDVTHIKSAFVPLEKIDASNEIAKMQEIRRGRQEKE
jgi:hypothetical protein